MKYLFIDSNIYRDIFSPSEKFSEDISGMILDLIDKKKIRLLIPHQVQQEVERNRFSIWYESSLTEFKQKIKKREEEVSSIKSKYDKYKTSASLIKEIEKDRKELEKTVRELKARFKGRKSRANQTLKKIFSKGVRIMDDTEVIESARLRNFRRNPPRDSDDHHGDAIIWETLLKYFRSRSPKEKDDELIFISNDKTAWGQEGLDLWLEEEWKRITKSKIRLVYSVSESTLETSKSKKTKKAEQDVLKENLINDFISSDSFINAGTNAEKLLSVKEILTSSDFQRIMEAALTNHEIYQSFFTSPPLKRLVSGSGENVIDAVENVPSDIWSKFSQRFSLDLSRIIDGKLKP